MISWENKKLMIRYKNHFDLNTFTDPFYIKLEMDLKGLKKLNWNRSESDKILIEKVKKLSYC